MHVNAFCPVALFGYQPRWRAHTDTELLRPDITPPSGFVGTPEGLQTPLGVCELVSDGKKVVIKSAAAIPQAEVAAREARNSDDNFFHQIHKPEDASSSNVVASPTSSRKLRFCSSRNLAATISADN